MNLILGIDIGTTNAKAILYDINGNIYNDYSESYPLYRDETGMAEQEPDDIVNSVIKMINQANTDTKKEDNRILAVSFSSANQSLILLDKNYQPLTRSITWADTRARKTALKLKTNKLSYTIFNNTGTPIHPMSPLVKLLWLRESKPDLFKQMTYIADIKSYLFYKLFGTFKIDVSIASSTGLFNIHKQIWDPEALSLIDITHNQLPQVVDATAQANGFTSFALKRLKIDPAITFVYGAFDGALSNLGVGALDNKSIAITIGTSAAVRIMTTKPLLEPQLFCYALDTKHWIVGGPLNNGGNIFQWAVEQLLDVNKDIDDTYAYANQLIAKVPIGAHGLIFHPFLNGARAPLWDANARGSFIGLNGLHTRSDMLRAVMEGINMNIYSVFKTVCELSGTPKRVIATGGFAKSEIWKQILADILNIPVLVPIAYESGTLGAAVIAMKSLGLIDDLSRVKDFVGPMKTYQPNAHNAAIYKKYLSTFEKIEKQLKPIYQDISNLQK